LAAYPKARSEPAVILPEGLLDMLQNRFGTASMRFNLDGRPRSSAQFLMSGTNYGSPATNEKLGLFYCSS
jgi:hypothetical protein